MKIQAMEDVCGEIIDLMDEYDNQDENGFIGPQVD